MNTVRVKFTADYLVYVNKRSTFSIKKGTYADLPVDILELPTSDRDMIMPRFNLCPECESIRKTLIGHAMHTDSPSDSSVHTSGSSSILPVASTTTSNTDKPKSKEHFSDEFKCWQGAVAALNTRLKVLETSKTTEPTTNYAQRRFYHVDELADNCSPSCPFDKSNNPVQIGSCACQECPHCFVHSEANHWVFCTHP